MFFPAGSVVNAVAIIAGSTLGLILHNRFPDRYKITVFQGLGLCVILIGLDMALKVQDILVLIFSILIGGVFGEVLRLEAFFGSLGDRLKALVRSKNDRFTEGLVSASLIFCIGAMAIVGALTEGLTGDPTVLYTKAMLDGFASIPLAATYGLGVLFSWIPVLLYQGLITLFAGTFQSYFTDLLIAQLSATGGVLILGIGITLLDLKKIRLASLLPSLLVVVVLTLIFG